SIKPENVMLLEQVPFAMLIELYAHCKGFITTSHNEDFGMTPVEAMASGKPVIAPNEGGYKESVIDGKTGTLIDDITVEKLVRAVGDVGSSTRSYRRACERNAARFDTSVFLEKMRRYIA
ncbi:MAG: glycosyltransferase, partial [Nanoarchaeota archaeon]